LLSVDPGILFTTLARIVPKWHVNLGFSAREDTVLLLSKVSIFCSYDTISSNTCYSSLAAYIGSCGGELSEVLAAKLMGEITLLGYDLCIY